MEEKNKVYIIFIYSSSYFDIGKVFSSYEEAANNRDILYKSFSGANAPDINIIERNIE